MTRKQLIVSVHWEELPVEEKKESEMNEIIATKKNFGYYPSEEGDGITIPDLYVPKKKIERAFDGRGHQRSLARESR